VKQLFAGEEQRFDAVLEAIRGAAEKCGEIIAVWVYGSVARGEDRAESDIDIAVVCEKDSASAVAEAMRETLREAEDRLAFVASVITIDTDDMQRLMATNDPWWRGATAKTLWVAGPSLDLLLRRIKRRATEHARDLR
jgi:predicted nucleotidyltransferase